MGSPPTPQLDKIQKNSSFFSGHRPSDWPNKKSFVNIRKGHLDRTKNRQFLLYEYNGHNSTEDQHHKEGGRRCNCNCCQVWNCSSHLWFIAQITEKTSSSLPPSVVFVFFSVVDSTGSVLLSLSLLELPALPGASVV